MESLSIVAYKQPITRSEVDHIRGVDSSGVMKNLLEKGLITIRGRDEGLGRALLYVTTPVFLELFGLNSLKDLPTLEELTQISGQKAVYTYAKKSIANFKLREGMPIGCKVTLRKEKMYDFFEKLIKISLPRVRDFRGLSQKSFDGRGNYTLGIKEHIIFPEIDFDRIDKIKGLDITITTTAKNDQEALELFKQFNFPFK